MPGWLPRVSPVSPSQRLSPFRSAKKCFFSESGLVEISVLRSPAGPSLCLASTLRSEVGSPWAHGLGRPFVASSWFCLWPSHSSLPSGRTVLPDEPWPGICGDWGAASWRKG